MPETTRPVLRFAVWSCVAAVLIVYAAGAEAQTHDDEQVSKRLYEQAIEPMEVGKTPNVTTLGRHIFFAGQPAYEDLERFKELGVETVLNLRTEPEMENLPFDEEQAAKRVGLSYVNIPVGRDVPDQDAMDRIVEVLDNAATKPVLFHCGSSNRVGYIWAMYRGIHHGLAPEDAIEEGKQAGLRSPALEEQARSVLESEEEKP